ncbi:MAG: hypothetical protein ACK58L_19190, partial [Planctomycetota bacterium]
WYTALDGFSTDWPTDADGVSSNSPLRFPANLLPDIDIVNTVGMMGATNQINYRVQQGLVTAFGSPYEELVESILSSKLGRPINIPLTEDFINYFGDLRAPTRPGFENPVILGEGSPSNHLTISDLYFFDGIGPRQSLNPYDVLMNASNAGRQAQTPRSNGGGGEWSVAGTSFGFVDGTFDKAGSVRAMLAEIGTIPTFGDELADTILKVASLPGFGIDSSLDVSGDYQLVTINGNPALQLTQTNETRFAELISLSDAADDLTFRYEVVNAGPADELVVTFDGETIGRRSLEGSVGAGFIEESIDLTTYRGRIGEFRFQLVGPTSTPATIRLDDLTIVENDDLTEGNLVGWSTFASDNASATVVLDTTRVQVGTQSLLFETQSGFDTGVRLTAPAGGWDLRNRRHVEYWCYGDNNTPIGWQGNQPIILMKSPGGKLTLTPTRQLMPNRAWARIVAPFAGNENFQVSTEGFFDLSNVTELEIHQDTWDYGFRAFYDGLKFAGNSSGITNEQSSFLAIPSVQTSPRPVISWTPITTAVRYDLWINNLTTGEGQFIREQNLSSISYVSSFDLPLANYSAWVRGIDSAGVPSRWSKVANFRVAPPVILQAMAMQQNTSRPIVKWNPLSGAVKYDVWLNNLSTGQSQFLRNSNVSGTSWIHTTDLPIGKYRAWVRGIDASGNTSSWSAAVDFNTVPAPSVTAPGASTFNRRPVFVWNSVVGAVQYDVFVKNLNTGATTFYPKGITSSNWTPPTSLPDGPYRWWVQARSAQNVNSLWSAPADVYIGGRTNITSPIGVQTTRRPVFTWQTVDGAGRYEIWVNNYQNTQRVIYLVDLMTTTFTPTTSLATGTYRAWVRAISTSGSASPWSTEAIFTV